MGNQWVLWGCLEEVVIPFCCQFLMCEEGDNVWIWFVMSNTPGTWTRCGTLLPLCISSNLEDVDPVLWVHPQHIDSDQKIWGKKRSSYRSPSPQPSSSQETSGGHRGRNQKASVIAKCFPTSAGPEHCVCGPGGTELFRSVARPLAPFYLWVTNSNLWVF